MHLLQICLAQPSTTSVSAGGEVYALYDAILGRTPDLLGFEGWASILKHGTASLHDVAASFLASPEGQSHVGSPNNATFVEQLYETALHRAGDSNGVQGWTNALNQGASRADVAIGFALSAENVAGMQTSLNAGVLSLTRMPRMSPASTMECWGVSLTPRGFPDGPA